MKLSTSRSLPWQCLLRSAVLVGASLACGGVMAQLKIDDVPPAVKNNVAPNFMFMIDRSGSMSNIVPAAPYSATGSYFTAACTGTSRVPPGTSVDLFINSSGAPRFTYGGNTYRHTTAPGATATNSRCFDNTATYGARLLGSPSAPSGYLDSDYSGRYLNWYFGDYDGPMTGWVNRKLVTTGAVESRIEIARTAATSVINSLPGPPSVGASAPVRVGLSTYSTATGISGGALRVAIGDLTDAAKSTLATSIAGLTPSGNTPLASTLADIGRYMATGYTGNVTTANGTVDLDALLNLNGADSSDRGACLGSAPTCTSSTSARPIQYWCQRSSVFMLTDGRPQNDRVFDNNANMRDYDRDCTVSSGAACKAGGISTGAVIGYDRKASGRTYESEGSDYMDDVAKALFDIDLRPDLTKPNPIAPAPRAKNNLTTYMIGFADPAVQNDALLLNTAAQGGGKFIAADNLPTLIDAFQDAITDALAKDASAAAVAVTNAQITAGSVGYASSYNSGTWYGDLEAYSLDTSTGLRSGAIQWSARDNLNERLPSSRKIASFDGTVARAFTDTNAGNFSTIGPLPTGRTAADVINWMRGDRTLETVATNPLRKRVHLLGDIINAEPVVVNYPSTGATVFQAANDGMLHVFDGRVDTAVATRGQELWAYVPRLIHNKLGDLANDNFSHKYLVDGTPATAEIAGTRILVGGLGKGGGGYYALDITTGTAASETDAVNKFKWEFNPANMGYSFGTPLIVNTAAGWRVIVASGYRNDTASGGIGGDGRGRVWLLNPDTGAVEKIFTTPSGFGTSTDSLGLAHLSRQAGTAPDAEVRYVYGGDLKGNVWRFDLTAGYDPAFPDNTAPVRIARLTGPNGDIQPVSSPPVIGPVSGSTTKVYVYVGTGQYFSDDDVPGTLTPNALATQTQTMYGIVDDTSVVTPTPVTRATGTSTCPTGGGPGPLVCQSLTRPNTTSNFTATANPVDLNSRSGFYVDLPIANSRVNTQPALTARGTLVFVANEPTNATCNPGGNSYFFALNGATGGAVPRVLGGSTYFDAGYLLANALSSRPVLITTGAGTRALFRLSDKNTESKPIEEPGTPSFKRIYKRALN